MTDALEKLAAAQAAAQNGAGPVPLTDVPARTLAEVVEVFRRWLYLPDPAPLYATLIAVAANALPVTRFGCCW